MNLLNLKIQYLLSLCWNCLSVFINNEYPQTARIGLAEIVDVDFNVNFMMIVF